MIDNPYAPPQAELVDARPAAPVPPFFAVSLLKLAVLSVCTLSLYELYWFYRNWQLVRARQEPEIMPFWRAFFAVIFCYSCFAKIRDGGVERDIAQAPTAGLLATGWILVTLTWRLPDPYWLVTNFAVLFMLPIQAYANRINAAEAPGHEPNSRFSVWNWLGVVVGGLLLLLVVLGTFLPEP
jgi:hypothetical protein